MKQIAQAFVKAQKGFAPALKQAVNPAFQRGGKGGRYADLAACVEAVIDALNANGIALIQQTHECTDGVIVETVLLHESGEQITGGKLHVPASKHDAQGYGSALTYARRYSLMATCGIAPEDDDGNAASSKAHNGLNLYEQEWLPQLQKAAKEGLGALNKAFNEIPNSPNKKQLWAEHSNDLKAEAQKVGA